MDINDAIKSFEMEFKAIQDNMSLYNMKRYYDNYMNKNGQILSNNGIWFIEETDVLGMNTFSTMEGCSDVLNICLKNGFVVNLLDDNRNSESVSVVEFNDKQFNDDYFDRIKHEYGLVIAELINIYEDDKPCFMDIFKGRFKDYFNFDTDEYQKDKFEQYMNSFNETFIYELNDYKLYCTDDGMIREDDYSIGAYDTLIRNMHACNIIDLLDDLIGEYNILFNCDIPQSKDNFKFKRT